MAVEIGARSGTLTVVTSSGDLVLDFDELQGTWAAEQYLKLSNNSSPLEFTDGNIEVLPMPNDQHQLILIFLLMKLYGILQQNGGIVMCAPLRMRIRNGMFREPDILLLLDSKDKRRGKDYWLGADLVIEIVSRDNPERDTIAKRSDYAEARIPEYWIVNPLDETITVLQLEAHSYAEHGVFRRGDSATSILLPDFTVAVDTVFDAD